MSVRKAHNSGRNHLRNVVDYYQQIGHERQQSVIDAITQANLEAGTTPGMGVPPGAVPPNMPFPPPGGLGGFQPPPGMGPPPGAFPGGPPGPGGLGLPPFPPGGMPPFMPPGMPPPFPPQGGPAGSPVQGMPFPPLQGMPFPPPNMPFPPNMNMNGLGPSHGPPGRPPTQDPRRQHDR